MVGWVHHYSSLDVYGITLVSQVGICACSPHKKHCNDYDIIMYNAQFLIVMDSNNQSRLFFLNGGDSITPLQSYIHISYYFINALLCKCSSKGWMGS